MTRVRLDRVACAVNDMMIPGRYLHLDLEHVEPNGVGAWKAVEVDNRNTHALLVRRGDVLVNKLRPYLRKVALCDRTLTASTEFVAIRPGSELDPRFLSYSALSTSFVQHAMATIAGVRMPRTSWSSLRTYAIPFLRTDSQRAIADFLDRECEQIAATSRAADRMVARLAEPAIALAEREFDEQPLGRIGYGYDVQLGKMLDEKRIDAEDVSPYLRNANVHWDELRLDNLKAMTFSAADRRRFTLQPGDLLVCEGGEPGRAAVWNGEIVDCYYQKALHRVRPRGEQSSRYLLWALRVLSRRGAFDVDGPGRFTHLTAEMLRAVRVPMPDRATQRERVSTIDRVGRRSRVAARSMETLQSRLTEYRDALITEAVTGQLDVTRLSEAQMDERAHAAAEGDAAAVKALVATAE